MISILELFVTHEATAALGWSIIDHNEPTSGTTSWVRGWGDRSTQRRKNKIVHVPPNNFIQRDALLSYTGLYLVQAYIYREPRKQLVFSKFDVSCVIIWPM